MNLYLILHTGIIAMELQHKITMEIDVRFTYLRPSADAVSFDPAKKTGSTFITSR